VDLVSAVRHPTRVTSGSSAPSAASRPRATSADRSAGPPSGRSGCSARRGDTPVPPGWEPSPPAPPFRLPPPGAAQLPHPTHLPVSGLHTSADPTGDTEFPDLEPCCGRAPIRSRRSYRRLLIVSAGRARLWLGRRRLPFLRFCLSAVGWPGEFTVVGPALTARHWRDTVNGSHDTDERRPHRPSAQAYARSWAAGTRRMSRTGTAGRLDHTAATAGQAARLTGVRAAAAGADHGGRLRDASLGNPRPRRPAPAGYPRNPLRGQRRARPVPGPRSAAARIHAKQPLTEQG